MTDKEKLEDAIVRGEGNDPIEPEGFSRKSLIILAAIILVAIAVQVFQWVNTPTDAVYETEERVILGDASHINVKIQIKYQFFGPADEGKVCSPGYLIEVNAFGAMLLTGLRFNEKNFSQSKFTDEFTQKLKTGVSSHASNCGRPAPEITDVKIESNDVKNIV